MSRSGQEPNLHGQREWQEGTVYHAPESTLWDNCKLPSYLGKPEQVPNEKGWDSQ
jgi:hypothetical protein